MGKWLSLISIHAALPKNSPGARNKMSEEKERLQDLLKSCPLLPNLTMLSMGARSKLLGEHSVELDEWYQKLKRFEAKLRSSNFGQWLICLKMDHDKEIRIRFGIPPLDKIRTEQILQYFVETEILGERSS